MRAQTQDGQHITPMEKNRIAFLCHPYHRGGVTRWMADAAIAYAARGMEVYFVTVEPTTEFYSGKGKETMLQLLSKTKNNVRKISTGIGREFEFGLPAANAHVYKKLMLANVPIGTPVILSDDSTVWIAGSALHEAYPIVGVLHADEGEYYRLARVHNREVDIMVCVSARVHRLVAEKSPEIGRERLFTIPCGIELPAPVFSSSAHNVLQLVYVGRLTNYQKRIGDLAKVAIALKKKSIPFHWHIIGDGGDDRKQLEQTITSEGLASQVTFTGWLSQAKVHEYMIAADILVLTSDFEGMPIAMMEGLASGCGFVGTKVSGVEDYENHPLAKDCFRVFDVGDIETAVQKIQEVAAVPVNSRQRAARELAENQFSMDKCLDSYLAAINSIPARQYRKPSISLASAVAIKSRLIATLRSTKMAMKSSRAN